jgi:hypothetical protein
MLATTRQEFVDVCIRKISGGNIEINVSDEAIDDCVDQALQYYQDYHYDGTEKRYYKHVITTDDVTNKYITVPDNCIGAIRLFSLSSAISTSNMFDIRYQIALNDLYTFTSVSMIPYYMAFQQIQFIEQLLVGNQPIRFNRKTNKVYLDMDWGRVPVGNYLILETYFVVDPEETPKIWQDRWLSEYCSQLIKLRWGSAMTKFKSARLPGGIELNGDQIYEQAQTRLDKMEAEMISKYSEPVEFFVG